jgi:hypothetical protein
VPDDFFPGWVRFLEEERIGVDNHPRRAVAALEGVVIEEGFLDWVQVPLPAQTLDGQHVLSGNLLDRRYARPHGLVVHDYGTRSAQGGATAELCTGEPEVITQHPEQHAVVVDGQLHRLAIQREGNASPHCSLRSLGVLCLDSSIYNTSVSGTAVTKAPAIRDPQSSVTSIGPKTPTGHACADGEKVWTRDGRSSIMKALIFGGPENREDGVK